MDRSNEVDADAIDVMVPPLGDVPTTEELIRHALAAAVDRLIRHDEGVRLGDDPEDVHQFRVAVRTLRSNLKTFEAVLDGDWASALRAELRQLGSLTGATRDLDVLLERLRRHAAELDDGDATAVTMLFDRITDEMAQARNAMRAALGSDRYATLRVALVDAAVAPQLAADARATDPAILHLAVRSQLRRLIRAVDGLPDPPSDDDLHAIRIKAKRVRYAIEAIEPVLGPDARGHAATIARLQKVLGEFHDSTFAESWLRAAGTACPSCRVTASKLVGLECAKQTTLRGRIRRVWRDSDATTLRDWLGPVRQGRPSRRL